MSLRIKTQIMAWYRGCMSSESCPCFSGLPIADLFPQTPCVFLHTQLPVCPHYCMPAVAPCPLLHQHIFLSWSSAGGIAAEASLQKDGRGLEHAKLQPSLIFAKRQLFCFNKHSSHYHKFQVLHSSKKANMNKEYRYCFNDGFQIGRFSEILTLPAYVLLPVT